MSAALRRRARHRITGSTPALAVGYAAGAAGLALAAFATVAAPDAGAADEVRPAAVVEPLPAAPAQPAPVLPAPVVLPPPPAPAAPPAPVYTNDLDGWIRQAVDILHARNIPASYDGIMRNVMRESTGNPQAINLSDSNAAAGTPSKGLLQVIDSTFAAYHVEGTAFDVYDPVANIAAACNYAASRYGSMDNVNSSY